MEKEPKNIILIGGAATTGKTTLAKELSAHLNIPWISTDQIRSVIKGVTTKNDFPDLFQNISDESSVEEIVDLEIKRAEIIWQGVLSFIENHYPWESFIIEGMAIFPHLVSRDFSQKEEIKPIFLVHNNSDRVKEIVLERSKLPFIKTKTEAQQESKINQIQLLNEKIKGDAEKSGLTIIEAHMEKTFNTSLNFV